MEYLFRLREAELLYDLHEASQTGPQPKPTDLNKPGSAPPNLTDPRASSAKLAKSMSCSDETLRFLEIEKVRFKILKKFVPLYVFTAKFSRYSSGTDDRKREMLETGTRNKNVRRKIFKTERRNE